MPFPAARRKREITSVAVVFIALSNISANSKDVAIEADLMVQQFVAESYRPFRSCLAKSPCNGGTGTVTVS